MKTEGHRVCYLFVFSHQEKAINTEDIYSHIPRGLPCSFVLYLEPNFYFRRSRRILVPIPQCTDDDTINIDNVMCCPWCIEQRVEQCHYNMSVQKQKDD